MEIELYGGPADGIVMMVPDDTTVWVVATPRLSTAEFLALEHSDPSTPIPAPAQLGYEATRRYSSASGARKFRYVGERVSS